MDNRIPVTLLTGFLGSGKTTLLNKLLLNPAMKNTAVIINELGEAGLDHILAQNVESSYVADNTVLLQSGCLCCTLSNELADTMRDLFFKRALEAIPQFNRIVIETTGMADPGPIMGKLLTEPLIGSVYRLDAVVVTIDAVHGLQQIETHVEASKQVAVADVLIMTKTDLANDAQITHLKEKLLALNPSAAHHAILHGEIDPNLIVDAGLFDSTGKQAKPERWLRTSIKKTQQRGLLATKIHDEDIRTFTVTMPKPLNWRDLNPIVAKLCELYGEKLLRLKGIIHAEDQPAPLAIHAVQNTLYPPTLLNGWDEDEPISRIVIIGKNINEEHVRMMLMQF